MFCILLCSHLTSQLTRVCAPQDGWSGHLQTKCHVEDSTGAVKDAGAVSICKAQADTARQALTAGPLPVPKEAIVGAGGGGTRQDDSNDTALAAGSDFQGRKEMAGLKAANRQENPAVNPARPSDPTDATDAGAAAAVVAVRIQLRLRPHTLLPSPSPPPSPLPPLPPPPPPPAIQSKRQLYVYDSVLIPAVAESDTSKVSRLSSMPAAAEKICCPLGLRSDDMPALQDTGAMHHCTASAAAAAGGLQQWLPTAQYALLPLRTVAVDVAMPPTNTATKAQPLVPANKPRTSVASAAEAASPAMSTNLHDSEIVAEAMTGCCEGVGDKDTAEDAHVDRDRDGWWEVPLLQLESVDEIARSEEEWGSWSLPELEI